MYTRPIAVVTLTLASVAMAQPQPSPYPQDGDVNGDGATDFLDLLQVMQGSSLGISCGATFQDGDLDWDGDVDPFDVAISQGLLFNPPQPDPVNYPGMFDIQTTQTHPFSNGGVTIHDDLLDHTLVDTAVDVWVEEMPHYTCYPVACGDPTPLPPDRIVFDVRDDGFDVTITYVNTDPPQVATAGCPHPGRTMGVFRIGRFDLAGSSPTEWRNFDNKGGGDLNDNTNPGTFDGWRGYAGDFRPAYSPATVLENDVYLVGVSAQYPVIDYGHPMSFRVNADANDEWLVSFAPNSCIDSGLNFAESGVLKSGETRTYQISVRIRRKTVISHENEWMYTLQPYRNYFRSRFGPVRYAQPGEYDARSVLPVRGIDLAGLNERCEGNCCTNPFSYRTTNMRPDLNGWGPWVAEWENVSDPVAQGGRGWQRLMIWALSGRWDPDVANDCDPGCTVSSSTRLPYPFRVFTNLANVGGMAGDLSPLVPLASGSVELGFWWGTSVSPPTPYTGSCPQPDCSQGPCVPPAHVLNPDNPADVLAADQEVGSLSTWGTDTVGLDAFLRLAPWRAYKWLHRLRCDHPGMKYVVEPFNADFMHTLGPLFLEVKCSNQRPNGLLIADFLNPGHETWGKFAQPESGCGEALDRAETLAENGIVPVVFGGPPLVLDRVIEVAPSWVDSVPSLLH